jgi:hypothetical protein
MVGQQNGTSFWRKARIHFEPLTMHVLAYRQHDKHVIPDARRAEVIIRPWVVLANPCFMTVLLTVKMDPGVRQDDGIVGHSGRARRK